MHCTPSFTSSNKSVSPKGPFVCLVLYPEVTINVSSLLAFSLSAKLLICRQNIYVSNFSCSRIVRYTCRGLFERHKLLFSFQMCSKILEASGKLNMDEYSFFLRGGVVRIYESKN